MKSLAFSLALGLAPPALAATDESGQTVVLDETALRNLDLETATAEETSFHTTVFALGEIDHTRHAHTVVSSRIAGRVVEDPIHEGEFAVKGQVLARIESRQPGESPPIVDLVAPADGLVAATEIHLGAPVEPDMRLIELFDLSTVWVVAKVRQADARVLRDDPAAEIRVPALGDEPMTARYLRQGVGTDAEAGIVEAVFTLPNPENRMRPGMRAEVSIIAESRDGVLSVPREAVQGTGADRHVFIRHYEIDRAFVKLPVVVGEIDGGRAEIVSGLFPGDEVVTRGAYALSFAGGGNASLKDALDAAHGHVHHEDGSEMTPEERAAAADGHAGGHDARGGHGASPLTVFFAVASGALLLLLIASPFVIRHRA